MFKADLKHARWAVLLLVALALIVAACGSAPTATSVPPTKAPAAPVATATKAPAAPTATSAPATSATKAPPTAAPASSVSFSKDILPIMQKNCTRCHGGSNPRAGVGLDSFQNVLKGGGAPIVTPGEPEKSALYTLVKSGAMPYGGAKLADADIQKIYDWIKGGAANN